MRIGQKVNIFIIPPEQYEYKNVLVEIVGESLDILGLEQFLVREVEQKYWKKNETFNIFSYVICENDEY